MPDLSVQTEPFQQCLYTFPCRPNWGNLVQSCCVNLKDIFACRCRIPTRMCRSDSPALMIRGRLVHLAVLMATVQSGEAGGCLHRECLRRTGPRRTGGR